VLDHVHDLFAVAEDLDRYAAKGADDKIRCDLSHRPVLLILAIRVQAADHGNLGFVLNMKAKRSAVVLVIE